MGFDPRPSLMAAYEAAADERDRGAVEPWKAEVRARFLERLHAAGAKTLLELGAGPGHHGRWFADQGLSVTATDLSPAMVAHCRAKGLAAFEADLMTIAVEAPFDAAFAMNCLLHIPNANLAAVLARIAACLKPGGLALLGQYSSEPGEVEGVWLDDPYEPKRFFSRRTDAVMRAALSEAFDVIEFRPVEIGAAYHFQAATVRRR